MVLWLPVNGLSYPTGGHPELRITGLRLAQCCVMLNE